MAGPMIVEASEPTLISRAPISKTSFQQDVLDCFSFLKRGERHSPPTTNSIASGSNRRLFLKPILHRHHNTMDPCIDAVPYRWPHDSSFDPKTTALVIIDMQKDCKYSTFILEIFSNHNIPFNSFMIISSPHF